MKTNSVPTTHAELEQFLAETDKFMQEHARFMVQCRIDRQKDDEREARRAEREGRKAA
jgi:hypothetical protein